MEGYCKPDTKELFVPFAGACDDCGRDHNYAIRRHEVAHAAWTPTDAFKMIERYEKVHDIKLDKDLMQVVEDMRIGHLMYVVNDVPCEPLDCRTKSRSHIDALKKNSTYERSRYLISRRTYPEDYDYARDVTRKAVAKTHPDRLTPEKIADSAHYHLTHSDHGTTIWLPSFWDTLRTVAEIQKFWEAERAAKEAAHERAAREAAEAAKAAKEAAERAAAKAEKSDDPGLSDQDIEDKLTELDGSQGGAGTSGGAGSKRTGIWGEMTINDLEKPTYLPGRLRARVRTADEGMYIREIHRLHLDGQIFGRKDRKPGGTILLDLSGSMSWDIKDVWRVLEQCPGAQIAGYSGNGMSGTLAIFAKDGRVCKETELSRYGGGNDVDGPALRWLCTQESPRIWISDGGVIAPYGSDYQAVRECDLLLVIGSITWLNPMGRTHRSRLWQKQPAVLGSGFGEPLCNATAAALRAGGAYSVAG